MVMFKSSDCKKMTKMWFSLKLVSFGKNFFIKWHLKQEEKKAVNVLDVTCKQGEGREGKERERALMVSNK